MRIFSYLRSGEHTESQRKPLTTTPTQPPKQTSTLGFRIINPELFIRPNKHVMNFGIAAMAGCVMYMVFMIASHDPKKSSGNKEKTFSSATGQLSNRSKWD